MYTVFFNERQLVYMFIKVKLYHPNVGDMYMFYVFIITQIRGVY